MSQLKMRLTKKKLLLGVCFLAFMASEGRPGGVCCKGRTPTLDQDPVQVELDNRPSAISFAKARETLINKRISPLLETYLRSFSSSGTPLKAFVSYAWPKTPEEQEVQRFLLTFVDHCKKAGIQAYLDLLDLTPGSSIETFMKTGIDESQVILVMGTSTYYERAFQETNVRFEFERILQTPEKIFQILYSGDTSEPFQDRLVGCHPKKLFDLRSDRSAYYLRFPVLLQLIYEQIRPNSWTESFQRSSRNYLTLCQQVLSEITDSVVEESREYLAREAQETEHRLQMQISLLAQNMPQDERFNPQHWFIAASEGQGVKRRALLDQLQQLLGGDSRVVFMKGAKGAGKNHLALSFAQESWGAGTSKTYTLGAVVPEGDLTPLQRRLKLSSRNDLHEFLSQTNYVLICSEVNDRKNLQDLLSLPSSGRGLGHVIITSSSLLSKSHQVAVMTVPSMTEEESLDLLTMISGVSDDDVWKSIAKKLQHHPGRMEKVALYAAANPLMEIKDLDSYLGDQGFTNLLERREVKVTPSFKRQNPRLRRQLTLRQSSQGETVSLKELVLGHLLRFEVEKFCQHIQGLLDQKRGQGTKAPGSPQGTEREDVSVWVTSPWDPSQRTLLTMERLVKDLMACGLKVSYGLEPTQGLNPYAFDVKASQEARHALLVGTLTMSQETMKSLMPLLKPFYEEKKLFPLHLEGDFGLFPKEYRDLLIEDISNSSSYAQSLGRVVEKILLSGDGKDAAIKNVYEAYKEQVEGIKRGLTEEVVQQQGPQVQDQIKKRDAQDWREIKRRGALVGYDIPPVLWRITAPDMTVGRKGILEQLHEKLGFLSEDDLFRRVVLVGLGGMGKSHLAMRYGQETKNRYTFGATLNAASTMTLDNDYRALGQAMGITLPINSEEMMAQMKGVLESIEYGGWLLVVDNADTPEEIKEYLPQKGGHLLITSRAQEWPKEEMIKLSAMDKEEGAELLKARSGATREEGGEALSEQLGHHPLALTQAGAYIRENRLSFKAYSDLLKEKPHLRTGVSATWAVTMEKIQAQNPDGVYILQGLSFLAPEGIPYGYLKAWAQRIWRLNGWALEDRLGRALQASRSYSMVTEGRGEGVSVHRLVQEALRETLSPEERTQYVVDLVGTMDQELVQKFDHEDPNTWSIGQPLMSHGRELIEHGASVRELSDELLYLSRTLGLLANRLGKYNDEMAYGTKQLEVAQKHYPPDHPVIAESLLRIGQAYGELGQYEERLKYLQRGLPIFERAYGPDHPEVAAVLYAIGQVYGDLGQNEEKLHYLQRALAILEKTVSPDHPAIAGPLYEIGRAYGALGKHKEQLTFQKRALAIREKAYSADHPEIATSLHEIGQAYGNLGKYKEQLTYLQRALAIYEKAYSPDHPHIAMTLHAIGDAYEDLGQYEAQMTYLQRALAILEKAYSPNHPNIASSLHAIGQAYGNLGQHEEQLKYLQRALAIEEKAYSADHPTIATSLHDIGQAYGNLGQYEEQLNYLQRALAIREKAYSPNHPHIAMTLWAIGVAYGNLGQYEAQLNYLQRALAIEERAYSPEHRNIATSLQGIGQAYGDLGQYKEQLTYLQRALAIREKIYSADHPEIATSLYDIGKAYGNLGHYEEQLKLHKRALAIRKKAYSGDHPEIATSLYGTGQAYGDLGQYKEQLMYLKRALVIWEKAYSADHPYLGVAKTNLGDVYTHLKRYREAEKNLEEALETFSKPGSEVARKVKALRLYGELRHKMQKEKEAMGMLKEALGLQEGKGMREHPDTALVLRSLGEVEQTMGQKEEAQKHLQEALSIQLQKLPQGHPETEKTKRIIETLSLV